MVPSLIELYEMIDQEEECRAKVNKCEKKV